MAERDFAVIGLGLFGTSICETLRNLGYSVLGIDMSLDRVQALRPYVTDAVQLDATDEEALRSVGITNYDAVVVALAADLETSVLVTLLLKDLGVRRVLAKVSTHAQQRVLLKVGADSVIFPEEDAGYRLAHSLVYPAISDFIDLGEDYMILQVTVRPEWAGRSLADLGLVGHTHPGGPHDYTGLQVQVLRRAERLICGPPSDERLQAGDVLAVVGTHQDLRALQQS